MASKKNEVQDVVDLPEGDWELMKIRLVGDSPLIIPALPGINGHINRCGWTVVELPKIEIEEITIRIVGDSPLVIKRFPERAIYDRQSRG